MNLLPSQDEQLLAASVQGVLSETDEDTQKAMWGQGWDRPAYQRLGKLGMLEVGALTRGGHPDPALGARVAEELGRAGAIMPFTVSVGWCASLLGLLDPMSTARADLLDGRAIATFAPYEGGSADAGLLSPTTTLEAGTGMVRLQGAKAFVPFLADADTIVTTASRSGKLVVLSLPVTDELRGQARAMSTVTGELLSAVSIDLEVDADVVLAAGARAASALRRVWARVLLLQSAYLLGGAARLLELTTAHVKVREQFGQPLGAFQAVQHHIADADVSVRSSRLMIGEQAWRESRHDGRLLARAAETKAWVAERTAEVARRAHELQGGLSVVDDHETARLFRRNLAVSVEDGAPPELWRRAAELRHVRPSIELVSTGEGV